MVYELTESKRYGYPPASGLALRVSATNDQLFFEIVSQPEEGDGSIIIVQVTAVLHYVVVIIILIVRQPSVRRSGDHSVRIRSLTIETFTSCRIPA